jgi:TolA-binding protein
MIRQPFSYLFAATLTLLPAGGVLAQSKGAADANAAAYETYAAGDYTAAAAAYEKLVKDYPTDAIIPVAQAQLAFSYYLLGQYDQALATVAKLASGPPLSAELKQITDSLVPQVLLSKAAAMPANDPKRTAAFNEAIKKFTDYIAAYPQSKDLENAIYSKAVAEYQIQKYDDAVKDLETNLQKFPQSSTIATSKNLLAITLATQGSLELNKRTEADTAKAFGLYKKAADYLREIINKKEDVALINEANFQLGEILFNQAAFSPEAERPALYKQAMDAYRSVAPKDQIVAWQQERIKQFPDRRRQAALANNAALIKQLNEENERELKKLAELTGKPDQVATALLKIGEIYFQQQKINEARVVMQHVLPFLQIEEDQKRALYFNTMTYAVQNASERATSGYETFQSKYKGDPLADNLPFTMGNMFLGLNNTVDAIHYFDQSLQLYPKGRYYDVTIVSKASAESREKKYDDAMKTFQNALSANPSPEIGVIAQFGIANIYKDTGKWDDAIKAFQTVREKYPQTPQAGESEYWIAISTQQKGDNAGAIPLLDAYVKANPKTAFAPIALYTKAAAQIALGQKEEGIVTMAEVADQYPESQPAPFTYFMRANLRGQEGKGDEVVALLKQFIEKYPKDDKVFSAYQGIAQAATVAGKTDEALATYRDYVAKYPESPQAGDALFQVADLQRVKAESLGRYGALNEQERSLWKTLMDGSVASGEELIQKYPDSPAVAQVLQTLLKNQQLLLAAQLKAAPDVQTYFQSMADKASNAGTKSKILFTLANFVSEQDKPAALAIMTEAYNPDVIYSVGDLDFYGLALIDEKKYPEASAVFEKIAKDNPIPPGVSPTQAPGPIQTAQATVLFGYGRVAQAQGQTEEAGKYFEQLKSLYPWSSKVLEADYGIAAAYKQQAKFDDALKLLSAVVRATNGTPELSAKSMLLNAEIMLEKTKAATDPKQKAEFLSAAIDNYIKIAQFYGGVPNAAAEGLYKGAQLLEQQAAEGVDPTGKPADAKFKTQQLDRAKLFYQQLIKDYPNSEYVSKAQERLKALGAQ